MRAAAAAGSAWDHVSPRRSRRAGTAARPLNIASRIPRHPTSPPTAPPAASAALREPHRRRWQILSACRKHIDHAGSTQVMGSTGWGPGSHPANWKKKEKSHNILTFCSKNTLLGSKALSVNLLLIFAFYLAATGKAFTNATNALRKVLSVLSGFLRKIKTLSS